ncbi:hypothetical protein V8E55_009387 [Tylopilus felleus]
MTLPSIGVSFFNTSDSFRTNPKILEQAFGQLRAAGVNLPKSYFGLAKENPNAGIIISHWDEQHKEMLKAPSYADAAKVFAQATTGTPKWYHAQLSGPTTALDKPVTEVSLVTVKRPENRAAVADILSRMPRVIGNPTGAFGPTRDDKNKYIAICGWESVEAHTQAVSKPEFQEVFMNFYSLADVNFLYHAKLKKIGGM